MERYIGIVPPIFIEELLINKKKKRKSLYFCVGERISPTLSTYIHVHTIHN